MRSLLIGSTSLLFFLSLSLTASIESHPLPQRTSEASGTLFKHVLASESQIDFEYRWTPPPQYEHEMVNAVTGGGVCIGDYDGDGKADVFLTQPFAGNRLYRNLGDFKFEDVTESSGLAAELELWGTGAAFADIDNDGDLDLYVCGYDTPNRLYINSGKGAFEERAAQAGVAYRGASITVAFADFDLDGFLDFYLCNNHIAPLEVPLWKYETRASDGMPIVPDELKGIAKVLYRPDIKQGKLIPAGESDKLYRNNGDGTFSDVSLAAGIADEDFGLSAMWFDYNRDGHPDLYNANDFYGADHFYHNNGDGTFTNINQTALPHTPWFSMGTDFADLNNDGWLDFMASDMQGTTHYKQKISMGDMQGWFLEYANPRQYMRNALYLNTGTPRFMEFAHLAGVQSTDWTWSLKFADLDSDGWVDLYVTNGAERYWDHSDLMKASRETQRIDTPELKALWLASPVRDDPNLAYRNSGTLEFESVGKEWGLEEAMVSYGAGYADLDGDGDLDLVVNNFEKPASVYRNESNASSLALIKLIGTKSNRSALGSYLHIESESAHQVRYASTTRGFMSSNDHTIHVGLGKDTKFNLTINWPSGYQQTLTELDANHLHVITEESNTKTAPLVTPDPLFIASDALAKEGRRETPFDDYATQPLLPWKLSNLGPGLAIEDLNADGLDDLYIGRSSGHGGSTLRAESGRGFVAENQDIFLPDAATEEMAPLFFDVDGDNDLDLLLVGGGVEAAERSEVYRDRLYINDGKGGFTKSKDQLPPLTESGGVAIASDFDRDGDLDLFIGARVKPNAYPMSSQSVLLINKGGTFTEAPSSIADLTSLGMVTGALWSDANGDGWPDLFVTQEWGPVEYYENNEGTMVNRTADASLSDRTGWWNSINGADFDHDGDIDYLVTNFGLNTKYHASPDHPVEIFYGDFDGSGNRHIIEAKHKGEDWLPVRGKSCSQAAMPGLRERFPTFQSFASATLTEIYSPQKLEDALHFSANELRTGILVNDGKAHFEFAPLPIIAQISPGFGTVLTDFNGDGHADIYLVQNFFSPQPETGRMNGGMSQLLLGDGKMNFTPITPKESGMIVAGDGKAAAVTDLNGDAWPDVIATMNDGPVMTLLNAGRSVHRPLLVRLAGPKGNPTGIGTRVTLHTAGAPPQTVETYAGGGYLSQSPSIAFFGIPSGSAAERLDIQWPDGTLSSATLNATARRVLINHPNK